MNSTDLESLENALVDMTACSNCYGFIGPLIFQCSHGHYFCKECIKQCSRCPTCRISLPLNGIRARGLEDALSLLSTIPCSEQGCSFKGTYFEMQQHEQNCFHRSIKCPLSSCGWAGKANKLDEHIETAHEDEIEDVESSFTILLYNPSSCVIDTKAELIVRHRTGKKYVIGFWKVKGQALGGCIMATVMYAGVDPDPKLLVSVHIHCSHNNSVISCTRPPWIASDSIDAVLGSCNNSFIEWDLALRSGQKPPKFKTDDQLQTHPQPSSLNLLSNVIITDPDDKESIDGETTKVVEVSLDRAGRRVEEVLI